VNFISSYIWPIALFIAALNSNAIGQVFLETNSRRSFTVETFGTDCIPDPSNKLSLITLALNNSSIQRELRLSTQELEALINERTRNNGSFSSPMIETGPEEVGSARTRALIAIAIARNEAVLDEIISPSQWLRLREIAYQTEIARIGIANAIATGRLGRDIGIYDNQKSSLCTQANRIEAKAAVAIAKVLKAAQLELLSELTPTQRSTAQQCLGEPFNFRDDDTSLFLRMQSTKPWNYSIPDPRVDQSLVSIIQNKSVQAELEFSESESATFTRLFEEFKVNGNVSVLTEVLTRERWTRLKELDYQIEIARIGMGKAITNGYLARDVGVDENQKVLLLKRASEIEKDTDAKVAKIASEAQTEFLGKLVPEQRDKAINLLGSQAFRCRPDDFTTYLSLDK
jgi:hypothetical protein